MAAEAGRPAVEVRLDLPISFAFHF